MQVSHQRRRQWRLYLDDAACVWLRKNNFRRVQKVAAERWKGRPPDMQLPMRAVKRIAHHGMA